MVGSIGSAAGSNSNLMNMISLNYQQSNMTSQGVGGTQPPPPPPPPGNSDTSAKDPLGVFDTVDTDAGGSISESEYEILTEGILEVTGAVLSSSFIDFDLDGDGELNGSELKSVLDEAGFAPPPQQVIAAYESQSGGNDTPQTNDPDLLALLMEYLKTGSTGLDITA